MGRIGGCDRIQIDDLEILADAGSPVTYILNTETRESKMAHQGHAGFKVTRRPGRLSFTATALTPAGMRALRAKTNATVTAVGEETVTLRNAYLVEDSEADMTEGTVPLVWEGPEIRVF